MDQEAASLGQSLGSSNERSASLIRTSPPALPAYFSPSCSCVQCSWASLSLQVLLRSAESSFRVVPCLAWRTHQSPATSSPLASYLEMMVPSCPLARAALLTATSCSISSVRLDPADSYPFLASLYGPLGGQRRHQQRSSTLLAAFSRAGGPPCPR